MRYPSGTAKKDFLDELIDEGAKQDPRFPDMVEAAYRRRVLLREFASRRERAGIASMT